MPQKVADAANTAPYLTHVVSHRGQLSLIPPDNAGRMRQPKPKKQRSINPDDDLRFNTGPKFYRVSTSSRNGGEARGPSRSNRSGRRMAEARENEFDDTASIPNYPPPSFDEAMSSPPISVCPSTGTATFINSTSRTYQQYSANAAPSSQEIASQGTADEYSDDPDSDSDVSLIASPGSSSPCEPPSPHDLEPSRSPTPSSMVGDGELEYDEDLPSTPSTPTSSKQSRRRRLSLSPLRTLLPRRSSNSPPRALSANPYSQSRNPSTFFRSTTSLSTFAFGRSAASSSTDKGKEVDEEALDSWEVVGRPTSLLMNVEVAMTEPSQGTTHSTPSNPKARNTQPSNIPSPPVPLVDRKPPSPKLKSQRDSKRRDTTPSPLTSFPTTSAATIEAGPLPTTARTRRTHSPPPIAKKSPIPGSPLRQESSGVRTPPDISHQKIFEKAINTPLPITPTERATVDSRTRDQEAPPIPPLPAAVTSTPASNNNNIAPRGVVCIPMHDGLQEPSPRLFSSHSQHRAPSRVQSTNPANPVHPFPTLSRPIMPHISTQTLTPPRSGSPSPIPTASSASSTFTITPTNTPTQSQFSHHYLGRPLPRPPPSSSRDMVDSTYSSTVAESLGSSANPCPEGLLIDFDEPIQGNGSHTTTDVVPTLLDRRAEALNGSNLSSSTQRTNSGNRHSSVRGRVGDLAESPGRLRTTSSVRAASVTEPSPREAFSQFTDLDVLVAGLDENELRNGSSYDHHLTHLFRLYSWYLNSWGLVLQPPRTVVQTLILSGFPEGWLHLQTLPYQLQSSDASLVDRRRTTKDGRVKVKLMVLESAVDKCGICLVQFKEGDPAAMSSDSCRHVFHEYCLKRWLTGASKTCPSCRVKVGDLQC
ncbi:hypothetical protein V5O48_012288 [Marasmius crinis-equi]|uniref:RING-type domain-containing protein n=1 Tax=Marasmius crinis-equi TaxID=585013 RepID=A0ABR3F370_9AGAR